MVDACTSSPTHVLRLIDILMMTTTLADLRIYWNKIVAGSVACMICGSCTHVTRKLNQTYLFTAESIRR